MIIEKQMTDYEKQGIYFIVKNMYIIANVNTLKNKGMSKFIKAENELPVLWNKFKYLNLDKDKLKELIHESLELRDCESELSDNLQYYLNSA